MTSQLLSREIEDKHLNREMPPNHRNREDLTRNLLKDIDLPKKRARVRLPVRYRVISLIIGSITLKITSNPPKVLLTTEDRR